MHECIEATAFWLIEKTVNQIVRSGDGQHLGIGLPVLPPWLLASGVAFQVVGSCHDMILGMLPVTIDVCVRNGRGFKAMGVNG